VDLIPKAMDDLRYYVTETSSKQKIFLAF